MIKMILLVSIINAFATIPAIAAVKITSGAEITNRYSEDGLLSGVSISVYSHSCDNPDTNAVYSHAGSSQGSFFLGACEKALQYKAAYKTDFEWDIFPFLVENADIPVNGEAPLHEIQIQATTLAECKQATEENVAKLNAKPFPIFYHSGCLEKIDGPAFFVSMIVWRQDRCDSAAANVRANGGTCTLISSDWYYCISKSKEEFGLHRSLQAPTGCVVKPIKKSFWPW